VVTANAVSNVIRNIWSYAIIFCGHFPDQTYTFTQEETDDETRGARHVRQLLGAAIAVSALLGLPDRLGLWLVLGIIRQDVHRKPKPPGAG